MENKEKQGINIEIDKEVATGVYANLAMINHSASEFVADFIQMMPGVPKAQVKSRVILTPQHAKRLANALVENINRYESQFGEIKEIEPKQAQATQMPFGIKGEA